MKRRRYSFILHIVNLASSVAFEFLTSAYVSSSITWTLNRSFPSQLHPLASEFLQLLVVHCFYAFRFLGNEQVDVRRLQSNFKKIFSVHIPLWEASLHSDILIGNSLLERAGFEFSEPRRSSHVFMFLSDSIWERKHISAKVLIWLLLRCLLPSLLLQWVQMLFLLIWAKALQYHISFGSLEFLYFHPCLSLY